MSVWSGWVKQLLVVAGLPESGDNDQFMADWHAHATTDCKLNPVDISLNISGASPCKLTSNSSHRARNYASHDQAAGQFAAQLHSGQYPHLLAALESGSPYTPTGSDKVTADLVEWGSSKFATRYTNEVNAAIKSGQVKAAAAHKGYADIQRSVNKHLPKSLRNSERYTRAALRSIRRVHRVKG